MTDKVIINSYILIAEFVAKCLGDNVEVVIHDFSAGFDQSVVAIFNGHVSGRQIGAPMTPTGLAFLQREEIMNRNYIANYDGTTIDGKPVRSSTFFIRNKKNKVIGTFCVNVDISQYLILSKTLEKLIYTENVDEDPVADYPNFMKESFPRTLDEHIGMSVSVRIAQTGRTLSEFTASDNMAVIAELEKQGLFSIKGSVKAVAAALRISQPTAYRYLERIRRQAEE